MYTVVPAVVESMSPEWYSCVDECECGCVYACAVVPAVGLQHLHEHVDLGTGVQLGPDLEVRGRIKVGGVKLTHVMG